MLEELILLSQDVIVTAGYPGVIFVAFLENFFPPLPSEVIFPFIGFVAGKGSFSLPLVIGAGVTGTFLGAVLWYGAGRFIGAARLQSYVARYGKYAGITTKDLRRAQDWFERHQAPVIFFGRLVPLVRTLISVPAGFSKMRFMPFSLLTLAGSFLWIGLLVLGGFLLGENWENLSKVLERYETAAEISLLILVGILFLKKVRAVSRAKFLKKEAVKIDRDDNRSPKRR